MAVTDADSTVKPNLTPCRPGQGGQHAEAACGPRPGFQPAAEGGDPFAHAEQAIAANRRPPRRRPVAVVIHLHGEVVFLIGQPDRGRGRPGVASTLVRASCTIG
jgi:hypothetical protein